MLRIPLPLFYVAVNGDSFELKELHKYFGDREIITNCRVTEYAEIKEKFLLAMTRAGELFGAHTFRRSTPRQTNRTSINKSVFESVELVLCKINEKRFQCCKRYEL